MIIVFFDYHGIFYIHCGFLRAKILIYITTLRFLLNFVKKSLKKNYLICGRIIYGLLIIITHRLTMHTHLYLDVLSQVNNIPVLDHMPYSTDLTPNLLTFIWSLRSNLHENKERDFVPLKL